MTYRLNLCFKVNYRLKFDFKVNCRFNLNFKVNYRFIPPPRRVDAEAKENGDVVSCDTRTFFRGDENKRKLTGPNLGETLSSVEQSNSEL